MNGKDFVKDYLRFTIRDRIGILCIVGIIGIVFLLPRLFAKETKALPLIEDSVLALAIDTLQRRQTYPEQYQESNSTDYQYEASQSNNFTKGELFDFDPNTLPAAGWKSLGLNDRTIKTIINYRTKGGKFYKPEDLKKIWGMPEGFYDRVQDYIRITSIEKKNDFRPDYPKTVYEKKERSFNAVNVNADDTTAFIALPGIGSKLAYRITNFRDKLGGFYSVEQIKETYGLPDSTFQKIKPYLNVNADAVKKININTATKEELKVHPYIKWNLANAIVEYRTQHGNYKNLQELKNIVLVDEGTFIKIVPYLSL
ncbi:MAG: helix-hairpin-helix domain-containing protein [Bacteroidota bacterium]|nr:helix-hairpin-helix domain-containing protein [Bacteroidota bacterium]